MDIKLEVSGINDQGGKLLPPFLFKTKGRNIMFKKFFDCVKLNAQIKKQMEALKTMNADVELLKELMEHPVKTQKQIRTILDKMTVICEKAL